VLVATVRALKHHGGNLEGGAAEIEAGAANLARHIGIVNGFGLQAVVGVNKFPTDTEDELELVRRLATEAGAYAAEINTAFENGGDGATALAEAAVAAADEANTFDFAYTLDAPIEEKIRLIATRVYGADGAELLPAAKQKAAAWADTDLARLPICMAKTPSLAVARSGAQERADRLHRHRSRPAAVHGRRLDRRALRRHDDDCRASARRRRRGPSTSTSRATRSVSSEASRPRKRPRFRALRRDRSPRMSGTPVLRKVGRDRRALLVLDGGDAERRQRASRPVGIVAFAGGQTRAVEPFTDGCTTVSPAGSSTRAQAAPETIPSACFRLQMTQ
jgi:hypothetical protein